MDISIIIVNYNTTSFVRACIDSIYRHTTGVLFEILVVDNASSDRSILELEQQFPDIQLILLDENRGFGAANNVAIEKAGGEFVFLLNPDTELVMNAGAAFVDFMRDPMNAHVGVCGAHLFTGSGKGTPSYGNFPSLLQSISSCGFYLLYTNYYRRKLDTGVNNTVMHTREVDFVSGAVMCIRKKILTYSGAFDTDFFLYFEETELCKRIRTIGHSIVLIPSIQVLHHEGGSTADTTFNAFGFYHFERSRRLYYRKVYGNWYVFLASPFDFIGMLLKAVFGKERGNVWRKVGLFFGKY